MTSTMRQAVILGSGGHCRVVLSILKMLPCYQILAIIELGEPRKGESIMGIPVIPNFDFVHSLCKTSNIDVFIAVGDNNKRQYWREKIQDLNLSLPNLISPHALVDDTVELGDSNIICPRAFIGPQVKLGNNNLINTAAIVEHEVFICNDCHIAPSATIAGRTRLDNLCFVGAGATIIDSLSVAASSTIGAGAVLVRNVVSPGGTYIGVPARRKELPT